MVLLIILGVDVFQVIDELIYYNGSLVGRLVPILNAMLQESVVNPHCMV